jgi:hypothetical protein
VSGGQRRMRKKSENNFTQPRDLLNGQSDSPTKKNQPTLYPKDVEELRLLMIRWELLCSHRFMQQQH